MAANKQPQIHGVAGTVSVLSRGKGAGAPGIGSVVGAEATWGTIRLSARS